MASVFDFKNTPATAWNPTSTTAWETFSIQVYALLSVDEPWVLELEPMLFVVDEPIPISTPVDTLFDLPYGMQLAVFCDEVYGDVLVLSGVFSEYYDDAALPLARNILPYGDSLEVNTYYEVGWDVFNSPSSTFSELWSVTEFGLVNTIGETYDLQVRNTVSTSKKLPYYLLDESTTITSPTVPVVVYPGSGTIDSSLSPGDPGYPSPGDPTYPAPVGLDFISINIEASMGQYCISCDITLPSADQYAICQYLDTITLTVGGTEFTFFVESRERVISNKAVSYQIGLLSPTALLEAPYAKTIVDNLNEGTGAQELVEEMAAIKSITVDWQILDWQIPGHAISINDETPLTVIRKVVNAVGAIVQTKPNGDMLIISKYPVDVPSWSSVTPDVTYSSLSDILSLSETLKINDGYNAFQITDSGSSSESITLEVVDVNGSTKIVKGYRVPFDDGDFPLETSGLPGVTIDKYTYPVEEQVPIVETSDDPEWEIVEFIDHTGSTSKPIYSVVDYDWIEDDLGAFQISEDGTLSVINTDSVPSESLLRIKYITKFWQWTVSGPFDRPVQFYVPEIEE